MNGSTTAAANAMSVLTVGLPHASPLESELIRVQSVSRGAQVLAVLRVMEIDLLLAGESVADMSVWTLLERVRQVRPRQRWVMVSAHLSTSDEIHARCLGALMLFESIPSTATLEELAGGLMSLRLAGAGK